MYCDYEQYSPHGTVVKCQTQYIVYRAVVFKLYGSLPDFGSCIL